MKALIKRKLHLVGTAAAIALSLFGLTSFLQKPCNTHESTSIKPYQQGMLEQGNSIYFLPVEFLPIDTQKLASRLEELDRFKIEIRFAQKQGSDCLENESKATTSSTETQSQACLCHSRKTPQLKAQIKQFSSAMILRLQQLGDETLVHALEEITESPDDLEYQQFIHLIEAAMYCYLPTVKDKFEDYDAIQQMCVAEQFLNVCTQDEYAKLLYPVELDMSDNFDVPERNMHPLVQPPPQGILSRLTGMTRDEGDSHSKHEPDYELPIECNTASHSKLSWFLEFAQERTRAFEYYPYDDQVFMDQNMSDALSTSTLRLPFGSTFSNYQDQKQKLVEFLQQMVFNVLKAAGYDGTDKDVLCTTLKTCLQLEMCNFANSTQNMSHQMTPLSQEQGGKLVEELADIQSTEKWLKKYDSICESYTWKQALQNKLLIVAIFALDDINKNRSDAIDERYREVKELCNSPAGLEAGKNLFVGQCVRASSRVLKTAMIKFTDCDIFRDSGRVGQGKHPEYALFTFTIQTEAKYAAIHFCPRN